MNTKAKNIFLITKIIAFLILAGVGYFFWCSTLVEWWRPLAWALAAGAISMPLVRRFLKDQDAATWILAFMFVSAAFYACILGANKLGADHSQTYKESAVIERKYQKENHRRGRHGRRVGTYYTYYIEIAFEDSGRKKTFSVPRDRYSRLRTGGKLTYSVTPGLLGWDTVD